MNLKYIISLLVLLFIGCSSSKKLLTTDNTKKTVLTERKTTIRKGDSISIIIPNIRYRDTVIERINYKTKTIARVIYDNNGNQQFDCISAAIKQEFETIKETIANDKKTQNKSNNSFNPQYLIYAVITLIGILIIGMIAGYVLLSKITSKIRL